MKLVTLYLFLIVGFVHAQSNKQVEKKWLKLDASNHTTVKSIQFFALDSLLKKDTNQINFSVLPDLVGSTNKIDSNANKLFFQTGLSFQLRGNINSTFSYDVDYRVGISNTELVPYKSFQQTKSFSFDQIKTDSSNTLSFYNDLRGKILYKPNQYINFSAGIDKQFIGEGERSLFLGNQGIAAPFVSMLAKYNKI